jgi:hypothetical protein
VKLSVKLRGTQTPAIKLVRYMMVKEKTATIEPKNVAALSQFFEINKGKYHEIWIVLTKKKYANPQPVSFIDAVSEAVKQGLIDSRTKRLNEQKYAVRFTEKSCR